MSMQLARLRPCESLAHSRRFLSAAILFIGWAALAAAQSGPSSQRPAETATGEIQALVTLPGPLHSFLRMSAISQKISNDEVLPLLARNIVVEGYHYSGEKPDEPTEYLKILRSYLQQARELEALAGEAGVISFRNCQEAQPLLTAIGYRLRQGCGERAVLETADPARAFLAADAGFPLAELEEGLRSGKPFSHAYESAKVPVLFQPGDWARDGKDLIDTLMDDPALARLYWGLSRMDSGTSTFLRQSVGLSKLLPFAAALDFYGSHIAARSGRIMVPGGAAAEPGWRSLAGANPASPAEFVMRLLEKDGGWLVAYFDTLSRIPRSQQAYFAEPKRLERFYSALRGRSLNPSPTRSVFRPVPDLFLLTSRLLLEADGKPHVPGNLEIWKEIFRRKSDSKIVRDWAKQANRWNNPDDLVEAMISLTRVPTEDTPLQVFLVFSEIDRRRAPGQRLKPQTVRLLAEKFSRYGQQYPLFSEWGALQDDAILGFVSIAESIDRISNPTLRANTLGIFQANVGFWQILARQGQIPRDRLNDSWQKVTRPFSEVQSATQLLNASRTSLSELWQSAAPGESIFSEEEFISLLAGPAQTAPGGQRMRQELAARMHSVLEMQRLASLDALFTLDDGLKETTGAGQAIPDSLLSRARQLQEFELPQPIFTRRERSEWASGLHNNPHMDFQLRTNLAESMTKSYNDSRKIQEARGLLTPFLRDILVGLNYAYYEPPGAQTLHNNSLFVRNHDFSGQRTPGRVDSWQSPRMFGRGWTASGGAHLVGSLSDLPYALAQLEQDFLVPENVQSLIWADLVPGLITSAVLPRWWNVTPQEFRAVALYQRHGEELITAAAGDADLRAKVMNILSDCLLPQRWEQVERTLRQGQPGLATERVMPAELLFLASEFRRLHPGEPAGGGAGRELEELARQSPQEVSWERISQDFGVPHPALARTYARELFVMKPLPTFLGYSSRLLAESWESTNLYWARLAEERGYGPELLN
ncbi:MAG: hypothetical protein HY648_09480, partial [Acidobacteria bacterium]|nr:hypothetical protein [Acidobacteriota bacterium]